MARLEACKTLPYRLAPAAVQEAQSKEEAGVGLGGRSRLGDLAWQRPAARAVVLLCPGCLPITNLPLVSLSCLPYRPLLCLNNHYLFTHSACLGSGLRPAG